MPFCNACGTETPEGARFCQNCGAELGAPVATATAPTPGAGAMPVSAGQPSAGMLGNPPTVPPYQAYPVPPYAVVPGQPYASRTSGKAVAGMWLGIISVFPGALFNWIGIIIGIAGLIFSLVGLNEVRANATSPYAAPQSGRNQAISGLILSLIGIALSTLVLVYVLQHLDSLGIKLTR